MDSLLSEIERNLEIATSTKNMVDNEKDMLQGDVRKRVVLHRFHTDAWDSLVNSGGTEELGASEDKVSQCYMRLKEANEVIEWFNRRGNRIAYLPLLQKSLEGYGRKEVIEVVREKCDESLVALRDARHALESVDL